MVIGTVVALVLYKTAPQRRIRRQQQQQWRLQWQREQWQREQQRQQEQLRQQELQRQQKLQRQEALERQKEQLRRKEEQLLAQERIRQKQEQLLREQEQLWQKQQQLLEQQFSWLPQETGPRSVSDFGSVLLPQIRQDDPAFPAQQLCEAAERYATATLSHAGMHVVQIHRVVFSGYDRNDPARTITMQLAIELLEDHITQQTRYSLRCRKRSCDAAEEYTPNCPNCGAPLGDSSGKCPYCGTDNAVQIEDFWYFFDLQPC